MHKKKYFILSIILFTLLNAPSVIAQNNSSEQLLKKFLAEKNDTVKFNIAYDLFDYYYEKAQIDSIAYYQKIGEQLAERSKSKKHIVSSYFAKGKFYDLIGERAKAIKIYLNAIDYCEANKLYSRVPALKHSIGTSYFSLSKYDDAIKYLKESIDKETDNEKKTNSILNIGGAYAEKGEYAKAISYFSQAKELYQTLKDTLAVAYALNNLGLVSLAQQDYASAFDYLNKAYKIKMSEGSNSEKASANNAMVDYYSRVHDLEKTKVYLDLEAKYIDTNIRNDQLVLYYGHLAQYYEGAKNYEKALNNYKKHQNLKTELEDIDNVNELKRLEAQKQFSKKMIADSLKNDHQNQINVLKIAEQKATLNKEKILRYALIFGLVMIALLGYLIYNRFRESKAKNIIIEHQNLELAKKNKETEDSLIYASRLQNGILPKIQELKGDFKDAFILYQPKDIVSGDFYWTHKVANTIYIAVGDCTGHGVPGAMMSFLSFNNLERCVKELNLSSTSQILEKLSLLIEQSFGFGEKIIRDGLDISLVKIDLDSKEMSFSGANNNLYLIQNDTIQKIKATRRSIGYSEFKHPFQEIVFKLQTNDTLFLLTDGYADQTGGEKNKKFLTKNLETRFYAIKDKTALQQKENLDLTLQNWMQEQEQIDDITILGLSIK